MYIYVSIYLYIFIYIYIIYEIIYVHIYTYLYVIRERSPVSNRKTHVKKQSFYTMERFTSVRKEKISPPIINTRPVDKVVSVSFTC